ncbi:TSUP family transporter, partial [Xanthomonas citri pv. citri]
AQGVLLMAILGIGVADTMQRHNASKNVLALLVNGIAAVVFVLLAFVDVPLAPSSSAGSIDWSAAGLIAVGSVIGGQVGAKVGRRLPPAFLRALIVTVGLIAVVAFLV